MNAMILVIAIRVVAVIAGVVVVVILVDRGGGGGSPGGRGRRVGRMHDWSLFVCLEAG